MELVIKIPEKTYKYILSMQFYIPGLRSGKSLLEEILKAIRTGVPLPKGHRFIDADEILNHAFITEDEEGDIFVQKYYCIKKEIMDNALVLFDTLEVDKEQTDGKV